VEKNTAAQAKASPPPPQQQPPPVSLYGLNPQERTAAAAAPESDADDLPGLVSEDDGSAHPLRLRAARCAPLSSCRQTPAMRPSLRATAAR
jgi:hypothetical protein